jgi:hypothetical protein
MTIRLIVILLLSGLGTSMADEVEDAGAKLYEYFAAFTAKETQKIANEIYSTPVHIGGGAGHRVLADPAAAKANLNNLYTQIETQGWVESRIESLEICVASETLALVDTRYSRLDQDGNPIPPAIRTTLYVLQKLKDDWRIIAFYGHDNDTRPGCNNK